MPSVLRFLSVIRHEYPRYKPAFSKKAQHLQRWIPLRMLTQGRLVPRQPWAIKRTTPTALHHKGISIAKHIHGNIGIKPTALYRYNIRNGIYIRRYIGIKHTALHHEGIFIAKYIHGNINIIPTALRCYNIHNGIYIHGGYWHKIHGVASWGHFYCKIHPWGYWHKFHGVAWLQHS